ncbi:type II toxin-antitoxin system Phd/YefM family antitoxin [Nocardia brasiliensis]|uniref:type II toxin-antitoxin system Phd/YefM family antitoxin n=1 Tax=Nocardia brasiliensis TaxID=37326 RepID=UPI0024563A0B|nr:type II toxin-antitoxin system Phd/YefM family antitoxin [Nocardia brasiliensis]
MQALSVQEFRDRAAEILRRVEDGEEFEILEGDIPMAKIVPLPRRRRWIPATEVLRELGRIGPSSPSR